MKKGRHWSDLTAAVRYYTAEGFTIIRVRCRYCKTEWDAVLEPNTRHDKLECPSCHRQMSAFVETLT